MPKEKMMASREDSIKKINEMIKKVSVAMLVTKDSDGKLRSRPMTTQKMDFDGELWFFVSSDANLVSEIKRDPEVNLAYSEDGRYVSVSGQASVVTNDAKKRELWHPELKVWFEGKEPESNDVLLINVKATEANYWETGDGVIGNAIRTVLALITGESGSPIADGHATFDNKESKTTKATTSSKQTDSASASKAASSNGASQSEKSSDAKASTQAQKSSSKSEKSTTVAATSQAEKANGSKTTSQSEKASSPKASGAAKKTGPRKKTETTSSTKTTSQPKK
jgi:general stress protein 26